MPRYFFTIRGRDRVKDDHYGTNLPDVAAALSTAESKIRELRKESGYDNDPTLMVIVPCRFFRATNSHCRNAAFVLKARPQLVRPGSGARPPVSLSSYGRTPSASSAAFH